MKPVDELKIFKSGNLLWIRAPTSSDKVFIKNIPGSSWDSSTQMYAVDAKYLNDLIANMMHATDLDKWWPPKAHPEEFETDIHEILEYWEELESLRTGTHEDPVPGWLASEVGNAIILPRLYQYQAARFMMKAGGAILALPMGYGKSLATITAIKLVMKKLGGGRSLIVCPAAIKELVWARELAKWSDFSVQIIEGPKEHRIDQYNTPADVYVINPELILRDVAQIQKLLTTLDIVVIDEAGVLKNPSSEIAKVAESILSKKKYYWELTGTPLMNNIMELYQLVSLVSPGRFRSREEFKKSYMPYANGAWMTRGVINAEDLIHRISTVMFNRAPQEIKQEMPESVTSIEPVILTNDQRDLYSKIRKNILVDLQKYQEEPPKGQNRYLAIKNVLAMFTHLKRLCCGLELITGTSCANPKLERVAELLDGNLLNDKAIIFSQYADCVPLIRAMLAVAGMKSVEMTGGMLSRRRTEAVDTFQNNKDCRAIVMTTAGGLGLNLTAATAVIFYDLLWNPKMMDQIIARAVRFGNTASIVRVVNIIATKTIEERILEQAAEKAMLFDVIMQGADPAALEELQENIFTSLLELLREQ